MVSQARLHTSSSTMAERPRELDRRL